jgi:2-polyprenyl-3-methyl-5-hydroxy-6-metoxy-1,4-benzoquinol methylase
MELKPRSSTVNARLWGARARDWADIQEATVGPVYEAVLERTGVGAGKRYLDVGCGAGGAAQLAAARGANARPEFVRRFDPRDENSSEAAVSEAHKQALAPFRLADGSFRIGASYRCLLARP